MMEHEPRWRTADRKSPGKDSILVSPYACPDRFRVRHTWNNECLIEFEYIDGAERGIEFRGPYGVNMTIGKFSGRILALRYPESFLNIFLSVTRMALQEFSNSRASRRGQAHDLADYNLPFIGTIVSSNYEMILKDFNKVSRDRPTAWEWTKNFVKRVFK